MRSLLQEVNWENMEDMTAELAWKYFSEHFNNIISQTVQQPTTNPNLRIFT